MNIYAKAAALVLAISLTFTIIEPVRAGIQDTIKSRVTKIRDDVNQIMATLRDGRNRAPKELKDTINDSVEFATAALDRQSAERQAFLDHGCIEFKFGTNQMLAQGQSAVTAALNLAQIDQGLFKTERAQARIEEANCKLLYPVYRTIGPGLEQAQADLADKARKTANKLRRLRSLLRETVGPLECQSGDPVICVVVEDRDLKCATYVRNAIEIDAILDGARYTVTGFELTSKAADGAGKIGLWKAAVAIWGWVGSDIEFNLPEFISANAAAVAKAIDPVVEEHEKKLQYCSRIYAQDQLIGKLNRLLET